MTLEATPAAPTHVTPPVETPPTAPPPAESPPAAAPPPAAAIDYDTLGQSLWSGGDGPSVPDEVPGEGDETPAETAEAGAGAPPVASPVQSPPAPATSPTEAPPMDDAKVSKTFAALSRREADALGAEKQAKAALADLQRQQAELKAQLEQAASLKGIAQQLDRDPFGALRTLGADPMKAYQAMVASLTGQAPAPGEAPAPTAANPELAALQAQVAESNKAIADLKTALEGKDRDTAAAQWRSGVASKIAGNAARLGALSRLGGDRAVRAVEAAYVEHIQSGGEEVPLDTMLEWVNDAVQQEAQLILGPLPPTVAPTPAVPPQSETNGAGRKPETNEVSPPERPGKGMTLSHANAASTSDTPEQPKTPAERARVLAKLRADAENVLKRGW